MALERAQLALEVAGGRVAGRRRGRGRGGEGVGGARPAARGLGGNVWKAVGGVEEVLRMAGSEGVDRALVGSEAFLDDVMGERASHSRKGASTVILEIVSVKANAVGLESVRALLVSD